MTDMPEATAAVWAIAGRLPGEEGRIIQAAHERVAKREDEPLCYTAGWNRDTAGAP